MGKFLEPTQAPRGAEITSIEARRRIHSNARLARYFVPQYNTSVTRYRQLVDKRERPPLAPYTSQISEGLTNLIDMQETSKNGGGL